MPMPSGSYVPGVSTAYGVAVTYSQGYQGPRDYQVDRSSPTGVSRRNRRTSSGGSSVSGVPKMQSTYQSWAKLLYPGAGSGLTFAGLLSDDEFLKQKKKLQMGSGSITG